MSTDSQSLQRQQALNIFRAGLQAVDPEKAVRRALQQRPRLLQSDKPLILLAIGKAAAPMARAAEEFLAGRLKAGLAVTKTGHGLPLQQTRLLESSHPLPDERGVRAAAAVEELVRTASADEELLCLISGGASALLPAPAVGLTLAEKQQTTAQLLRAGADIAAVNCVRKHISTLKGGGLARLAAPAPLLALLISDVIGNDPATIGSGLTAPDPSRFADAWQVIEAFGLLETVPPRVIDHLQRGCRGLVPETLKPDSNLCRRVENRIIASIDMAAEAAAAEARRLGYRTRIMATDLCGEAAEVPARLVAAGRKLQGRDPLCLIWGGETTVTLRGHGRGGRNQELALAAIRPLAEIPGAVLLAAGTDGSDGPTDAAGGLVDAGSLKRALARGLTPETWLERNDSYPFLQQLGDLLVTGPTRTNVMDLTLLLLPGLEEPNNIT